MLVDRAGAVTHVMVGDPRCDRAAGLGPHARRPRAAARPALHPHPPRRRGALAGRPDRPREAPARRDGERRRRRAAGCPGARTRRRCAPAGPRGQPASSSSPPAPPSQLDLDFDDWIRALEEELARATPVHAVDAGERAILVAVTGGRRPDDFEYSLEELRELASSAGVERGRRRGAAPAAGRPAHADRRRQAPGARDPLLPARRRPRDLRRRPLRRARRATSPSASTCA